MQDATFSFRLSLPKRDTSTDEQPVLTAEGFASESPHRMSARAEHYRPAQPTPEMPAMSRRCPNFKPFARCGKLHDGMSLIVAVRDDRDVVVASDGRVLAEDRSIMANEALKTLALNPDLCIGIAGHTESMRKVLNPLGLKCRRSHPADLLTTCQEVDCPIDVSFDDVRTEVSGILRWMVRRTARVERESRIPAILLAGRRSNAPVMCSWSEPRWIGDQSPPRGFSESSVGMLPDHGSLERTEFQQIVRGRQTTDTAEERLTTAVRLCARHFGAAGPIGHAVFLRRLSKGFELTRARECIAPLTSQDGLAMFAGASDLVRRVHGPEGKRDDAAVSV